MTNELAENETQSPLEESARIDLRSHTLAEDKIRELLSLFPEVRTEDGKIDFDHLKLTLGENVDAAKERYGLNWPGRAECFRSIMASSLGTLRPVPSESINWNSTENVFIEGDNLETLKLLQKAYLNKVKIIFIDPPYNTGNDFIYPDNYSESIQTYLEYTGQVDSEGRRFSTNTEADGRFHSKWLNMMYPRLYLAKNLLRDDGVILVTIDDTEVANLRLLMNDVFGEENFVANVVWQKRYVSNMTAQFLSDMHDHILIFARNKDHISVKKLERTEDQLEDYKNPDNDPRGPWRAQDLSASKPYQAGLFTITGPTEKKFNPPPGRYWRCNEKQYNEWLSDNRIWFGKNQKGRPMLKAFLSEATEGVTPNTWWTHEFAGHNKEATLEMKGLFDGASPFDTSKPVRLVRKIIDLFADDEALVLDFFAGSATTAHAVLEANQADGGRRRFILVQLPEPTSADSVARKMNYLTISDIAKERIRRAIKKLNAEDASKLNVTDKSPPDRGFRTYRLDKSNFKPWDADFSKDATALQMQLFEHINHIREDRNGEDILYEILLKSGFSLTTQVEAVEMAGKKVFCVAGNKLFICLDQNLTLETIRAIADKKPERIICLDEGFEGNDQLKANAVLLFKAKNVTSFKTV